MNTMNDVSRYVKKEVRETLLRRSNGFCECCGADIPTDRHHILEFSKGGESSHTNLIILCQSCHKQLLLYLDLEQQRALQKWHSNNTNPNTNAVHIFSNPINQFVLGSNTFSNCRSILRINGQSVITPEEIYGRFYTNIVMLDPKFNHQMLVLGNKVIKNSKSEITTSYDSLKVMVEDKVVFKIYKHEGAITINLDLCFDGKEFTFNELDSKFPGMLSRNNHFPTCSTAIDYSLIGDSWNARIGVS